MCSFHSCSTRAILKYPLLRVCPSSSASDVKSLRLPLNHGSTGTEKPCFGFFNTWRSPELGIILGVGPGRVVTIQLLSQVNAQQFALHLRHKELQPRCVAVRGVLYSQRMNGSLQAAKPWHALYRCRYQAINQSGGQALVRGRQRIRRIPAVPAEKLVSTVPGKDHLHLLTGEATEQIDREPGRVTEWLIVVVNERLQRFNQVYVVNLQL